MICQIWQRRMAQRLRRRPILLQPQRHKRRQPRHHRHEDALGGISAPDERRERGLRARRDSQQSGNPRGKSDVSRHQQRQFGRCVYRDTSRLDNSARHPIAAQPHSARQRSEHPDNPLCPRTESRESENGSRCHLPRSNSGTSAANKVAQRGLRQASRILIAINAVHLINY